MKQLDLFKIFLLVVLFGAAGSAKAQTMHPLHFGTVGTGTTTHWYQDYVGVRFEVLSPLSVAGDKQYSYAYSGTSSWGAPVTAPLINKQIVMPQAGDSLCNAPVLTDMTGKIAFVYRGGGINFSDKAALCFAKGAIAVVIVNNQSNGVIGMSAATPFSGCPVFMITKADGDAIDAKYHSGVAGDTARMTITLWGQNNQYDLGLIPQGISMYHDYAMPYAQLTSGINPVAYKGQNGAFIGNFGTRNPGHVTLNTVTTFYPGSGPSVTVHSDNTTLASFPPLDSIWTIYGPQYDMTGITAGTGRVGVKYTVTSDSTDQYLGDDTASYSFYLTDSLYSKGRYDFVKHKPVVTLWEAPVATTTPPTGDFFLWGPMYYVAKGGGWFDSVQFSLASNSDTGHIISSINKIPVYIFKWVDGAGGVADSFVENGELRLVGSAVKGFPGVSDLDANDTSGGIFSANVVDSMGTAQLHVDSNSWYFIAPEVPNTWFVGLDGNSSSFARTYGRGQFNNYVEYPSTLWSGALLDGANPLVSSPGSALEPWPFGGSFNLDSVSFASQKGLIPAVPFTTTSHVDDVSHVGVNQVKQAFQKFVISPNPASDVVNADMAFETAAGSVTYTIIDGSARVVAKVAHDNVALNDKFSYNTNTLATGNYFLVVYANGKQMFKKFTVIR